MHQSLGSFRAALLIGWLTLSAAGWLYAREKGIPVWAAVPIVAAFLLEYSFYLAPGFEAVRERLRTRLSRGQLAAGLVSGAIAPYLVSSLGTGQFRWQALAQLTALAMVVCCWYLLLPPSPVTDILFLILLVAVVLAHIFERIYASPVHQRIDILGQLMLIRTGALVMLLLRNVQGIGLGFLPTQREWIIGVRHFFYFLPVGVPLALGLGLSQFTLEGLLLWKTLATFFGALWVVALSEEFVFRGLLQQWLEQWTGSAEAAVLLASLAFGLCHLPFRSFPNWKLAAVAAIAGWFYGRAYRQAGAIRASMVTHALVVTTWRVLFA